MGGIATKIIPAVKITGANLQFPTLSNEHVPDICRSMSQVLQGCEETLTSMNAKSKGSRAEEIPLPSDEELEFGEFLKDAAEWL